jgi:ABC-type transport system involved in cytochrome bd biosynthesis fused ATPase/permease subunit
MDDIDKTCKNSGLTDGPFLPLETGLRLVHRTLNQLVANGTSILMVSHNSLMLESTDQVYEMDQGRVVRKGRYGYL